MLNRTSNGVAGRRSLARTAVTLAAIASALALIVLAAPRAHAALQPVAQSHSAAAQAPTPLDRYLKSLKTLRVTFLQTIADAQGAEVGRSSGTLTVERPGKFRWDIHPQSPAAGQSSPPGQGGQGGQGGGQGTAAAPTGSAGTGQLMVSDGRNLWYYDRDLEQVTVRPVTAALSATPAMLLSGTVDVHQHFTESNAGTRDGLAWVYVEPRGTEADFKSALFGFDPKGTLRRMILEDKLGQIVTIIFEQVAVDVAVPAGELTFTPPPGTDVIGTPAK